LAGAVGFFGFLSSAVVRRVRVLNKLLPTLRVEIHEDYSDLSPQHRLTIEQQYFSITQIDRANEQLDAKALQLLQAAGLILVLVGALEIPKFITSDPTLWARSGIFVGFLAFAGMVYLLASTVKPGAACAPGSQDWNEIYDEYLIVKLDDSYNKVLVDCLETFDRLSDLNQGKAKSLQWAIFLFVLQVTGLLTLAMAA
jgi:hypothetical protein